jgi:ATP adenylyltransferase
MGYILTVDRDEDCFICEASGCDIEERGKLLVFRRNTTVALLNKFPYNNGHMLIAPCAHKGELEELTVEERCDLFEATVHAKRLLTEVMDPHGFNVGLNIGRIAGAGVPEHLHFHIVPRWSGDTNFMPVFAGVKVVPQALDELLDMLREAHERATSEEGGG